LEVPGLYRGILLKWIFKKYNGEAWIGLICEDRDKVVGSCEYGNELSGSIK
jgi:hypothetical protein